MNTENNVSPAAKDANSLIRFFKKVGEKVAALFQPEEVEVTFKGEGNKKSYTYTKVHNKQAA